MKIWDGIKAENPILQDRKAVLEKLGAEFDGGTQVNWLSGPRSTLQRVKNGNRRMRAWV